MVDVMYRAFKTLDLYIFIIWNYHILSAKICLCVTYFCKIHVCLQTNQSYNKLYQGILVIP